MTAKTNSIELDEATAAVLKERADDRGISVPDLVAEFAHEDREPVDVGADQIAELDRRWAAVEAGQPTVSNGEVVRWLSMWSTPAFKPWGDQ
jgi:predicted transcriptional regulator